MINILLVGCGAREHAIARAIKKSPQNTKICHYGSHLNPGIKKLSDAYITGAIVDPRAIISFAKNQNITFAIIGPEAPLGAGVIDALQEIGIPSIGPTKLLAQIETSKSFTRQLLTEYQINVCPQFQHFTALEGVEKFIDSLAGNYVVKADGLMGGKGVRVAGDHLKSVKDALNYCQQLIKQGKTFLIEEKLVGPEFSLMSFSDGEHLAHLPPVQDHKRAYNNDEGPNTGGMGSYSAADHSLPFLTPADIATAQKINQATSEALKDKFGQGYKGILYGGFMATHDGIKLIEYNARLGDPEAMNVLPLLKTDLVALCQAIIEGDLRPELAQFEQKATVCKYAVPQGYPDNPMRGETIDVSAVQNQDLLFFGAVDVLDGGIYETGSRTVAVVGIADTIAQAERLAEAEIKRVKGPLFHREDIGTAELIEKRVKMMEKLRQR